MIKVGDRVKIIHKTNERYGQEGRVEKISNPIIMLSFEECDPELGEPFNYVWVEKENVELVEPKFQPQEEEQQKEDKPPLYHGCISPGQEPYFATSGLRAEKVRVPDWVIDRDHYYTDDYEGEKVYENENIATMCGTSMYGDKKTPESVLQSCIDLYREKNKEYQNTEDQFENFTKGAELNQCSKEQTLWGYVTKQVVSLASIINTGKNREKISEKARDIIVYMAILEAMQ